MISDSQHKGKEEKMAANRPRNDFISFLIDTEKNPKLTDDFLSKKTVKDLHSFFLKKGYKDIPYNDCQDIIKAKKLHRGKYIPGEGERAQDCPVTPKEY